MKNYRVVLADDHTLVRRGIKLIIEQSEDIAVVGEADNGFDLLRVLRDTTPDMVILDLSMPRLRGLEAIREIQTAFPEVKILILTMHRKKEYLHLALSSGASGYLLKEDAATELFSAIRSIRRGSAYVSTMLSNELTEMFVCARRGNGSLSRPSKGPLTNREGEVLKLIAEGRTSKEVAKLLCISARTVDHHRAKIMKKLCIKKSIDLVKYAIREGHTSDSI